MLQDKSIVITGAGRGLGRDAAVHCAALGANVVVNDVDGAEAESTVEAIRAEGGTAVASSHSVADHQGAQDMIELCISEFGRLDGLVNNAGLVSAEASWEATEATINSIVDVNVKGALFCGTAALKHMREQRGGVIVNLTSRTHVGISGQSVYATTKGALASMTYNWAVEMAEFGVRVVAFSPRAKTRMWASSVGSSLALPLGPEPSSEDVALAVPYLLSDRAAHLSGQVVRFDGQCLSIMRQPVYDEVVVQREHFTLGDIGDAIDTELAGCVRPVGVDGDDLSVLPLRR